MLRRYALGAIRRSAMTDFPQSEKVRFVDDASPSALPALMHESHSARGVAVLPRRPIYWKLCESDFGMERLARHCAGRSRGGPIAGRAFDADSFDAARRLRAANEEPEMSDHHGALTARSSVALVGVADDSVVLTGRPLAFMRCRPGEMPAFLGTLLFCYIKRSFSSFSSDEFPRSVSGFLVSVLDSLPDARCKPKLLFKPERGVTIQRGSSGNDFLDKIRRPPATHGTLGDRKGTRFQMLLEHKTRGTT